MCKCVCVILLLMFTQNNNFIPQKVISNRDTEVELYKQINVYWWHIINKDTCRYIVT